MKLLLFSGKPRRRNIVWPIVIRQVAGESMLPALRAEQLVVCRTRPGQLKVNDVVIIRHRGLDKIKRIQRLSATHVWVVGDNPHKSTDSRSFGWLSVQCVTAKVLWPSV